MYLKETVFLFTATDKMHNLVGPKFVFTKDNVKIELMSIWSWSFDKTLRTNMHYDLWWHGYGLLTSC